MRCSVPLCKMTRKLHSVPFGNRLRWKQWTTSIPAFRKYKLRQLENVRICDNHFLPRHINEHGRLTKDAIPVFQLNLAESKYDLKGKKVLEICPLQPKELVNVTIVDPSLTSQIGEKYGQVKSLVVLKEEGMSGLPVDHKKYCLPIPTDQKPTYLSSICDTYPTSSIELLSCEGTMADNETEQKHILQSNTVVHQMSTKHNTPDSLSTNIEHSQQENQKVNTVQNPQCGTFEDDNITQNNVYNLPYDLVTDKSLHKKSQEQSSVLLKPNVFNAKPNPQKQTLESLVAELTDSPPKISTSGFATLHPVTVPPPISLPPPSFNTGNTISTEQKLRMQINTLKKKVRSLNVRYKYLKTKSNNMWAKAKVFIKNYPHLSPEEKLLVDVQIRLAKGSSKGYRYREEEKMLALKLYTISPQCYKFLQTYLKLPAKTTVDSMIKNALKDQTIFNSDFFE